MSSILVTYSQSPLKSLYFGMEQKKLTLSEALTELKIGFVETNILYTQDQLVH